MGGQCALRWCGRTSKEPKARSERPAEPRENTGANRRGSILEPPKSATLPNLANAATAGISPQKLAIGEKVPPGGLTGGSPQVGPVCEATSPLATLGPARSKPPSRSAQVEMKETLLLSPSPLLTTSRSSASCPHDSQAWHLTLHFAVAPRIFTW